MGNGMSETQYGCNVNGCMGAFNAFSTKREAMYHLENVHLVKQRVET